MSDELSKKDVLVNKAIDLGLGDEKFLSKISEENLNNMVALVESKDGQSDNLKAAKSAPKNNPKIIRVSNLVAAGRIGVAKVAEEPEEKPDTKEDE